MIRSDDYQDIEYQKLRRLVQAASSYSRKPSEHFWHIVHIVHTCT